MAEDTDKNRKIINTDDDYDVEKIYPAAKKQPAPAPVVPPHSEPAALGEGEKPKINTAGVIVLSVLILALFVSGVGIIYFQQKFIEQQGRVIKKPRKSSFIKTKGLYGFPGRILKLTFRGKTKSIHGNWAYTMEGYPDQVKIYYYEKGEKKFVFSPVLKTTGQKVNTLTKRRVLNANFQNIDLNNAYPEGVIMLQLPQQFDPGMNIIVHFSTRIQTPRSIGMFPALVKEDIHKDFKVRVLDYKDYLASVERYEDAVQKYQRDVIMRQKMMENYRKNVKISTVAAGVSVALIILLFLGVRAGRFVKKALKPD